MAGTDGNITPRELLERIEAIERRLEEIDEKLDKLYRFCLGEGELPVQYLTK